MLTLYVVFVCLVSSVITGDTCLRYRTGGASLKVDIEHLPEEQEMITLRGNYNFKKHRGGEENAFNGFFLARNSSVSDSGVDFNIFNKLVIPKASVGETYAIVPTKIRKCCDFNSGLYYRDTFDESIYARKTKAMNVYQLVFKKNTLYLTINGKTTTITKPYSTDPDLWKIGHVRQRGNATNFYDVTVCPLRVSVVIVQDTSLADLKEECEAGRDCQSVGRIVQQFGTRVILSCFASGPPPMDIWWELNGDFRPSIERDTETGVSLSMLRVDSLDISSVGNYSCVAQNKFDKTIISSSYISVLGYGPISLHVIAGAMSEITCNGSEECGVSTKNVATLNGEELTLSCKAFGSHPSHLWWSFEGRNLTNGESIQIRRAQNLTEISFTMNESRTSRYKCLAAYNKFSEISSNTSVDVVGYDTISLHVIPEPLPGITCTHSNDCGTSTGIIARLMGEQLTMSCKAFGSHSSQLWWSFGGENLTDGDSYQIKGAQNVSEISFTVNENKSAWYKCHAAYNDFNEVLSSVPVYVFGYKPISLYIMPVHLLDINCDEREYCGVTTEIVARLIEGEITMSCKAFGSHSVHLWWAFGGENLTDGESFQIRKMQDLSEISFAMREDKAGWYECNAAYDRYNKISSNASVYVFGYEPLSQYIIPGRMEGISCNEREDCGVSTNKSVSVIGEKVSISCKAFGSHPTNIWWTFGEVNLTSGATYQIRRGQSMSDISFTAKKDTTGWYKCHAAYNKYDKIFTSVPFHVFGYEPIFLHILPRPMSEVSCNASNCGMGANVFEPWIGEEFSMSCVAFGSHPTEITWSIEGEKLKEGGMYQIRSGEDISEVSFNVARKEKSDWYKCKAAYIFNTSITSTSLMEVSGVFPLSVHILEPKHVVATPGVTVKFVCLVFQWPFTSTVNWRHLNSRIHSNHLSVTTQDEVDEQGHIRYKVVTLEFETARDSDNGVFVCGNGQVTDTASLFVETIVETPFVNITETDGGEVEVTCWTRANPPATLHFTLSVDQMDRKQELKPELTGTTRSGSLVKKGWVLRTSQKYFRMFFVCEAVQGNRKTETSGHFALTRPIKTAINIISSSGNNFNFNHGEFFEVNCKASGNPAPKQLILIKDGHVIEQFVNDKMFQYEIELNSTFENVTINEDGWYSCHAFDTETVNASTSALKMGEWSAEYNYGWTFCRDNSANHLSDSTSTPENWTINEFGYWFNSSHNELQSLTQEEAEHGSNWYSCRGNNNIIDSSRQQVNVFQEISFINMSFRPDVEVNVINETVYIPENTYFFAECLAGGGSPMPELIMFLNEVKLDGRSEIVGKNTVLEVVLKVNSVSSLRCEAKQNKFGEDMLAKSHLLTLIPFVPLTSPTFLPSKVVLIHGILYWSIWVVMGLVALGSITGLILLLYLCINKGGKEDEVAPLSSSEEEGLRTQSVDLASRRMELLTNLYDHPVRSPSMRITRSMSRSREGLESMRQRQRTQSGDTLDGVLSRQNTPSREPFQGVERDYERDYRQNTPSREPFQGVEKDYERDYRQNTPSREPFQGVEKDYERDYRQNTPSREPFQGVERDYRERAKSGDLLQDDKEHRKRAQSGDVVLDDTVSSNKERHTSC